MTTHTSTTPGPTAAPKARGLAVAGAVLATGLLWLAGSLLGADLRVTMGEGQAPQDIGLPMVLLSALAASLLGWGARALLGRFTRRAGVVWTVLAGAVLLVSFAGPVGADATPGTRALLALMHVAVAAVLIPVLGRTGAGRAERS